MRLGLLVSLLAASFPSEAQPRPVLVPLRAIGIIEQDTSPLTAPRSISVDPDGGFYIVDNANAVVGRFASNGTFVRSYGRSGDGLGEFRVPTHAALINDSTLAVTDVRRGELSFFRRSSGAFVSRVRLPGRPGSIHGTGANVWVGALDVSTRRGAVRVNPLTGTVEASVVIPAVFRDGSPVTALEYGVHIVPHGDGVVVGFSATNYLLSVAPNRGVDTLQIPVLRRRGVPPDLIERIPRIRDARDFYELLSSTVAVERLPSGTFVVAHVDAVWRPGASFPTARGGADPFTYKLHVSLIKVAERQVCADVPVPVSGSVRPNVAVRGDSLMILDQDESNDLQPWQVRGFLINETACAWQRPS